MRAVSISDTARKLYREVVKLMGNRFEISVVDDSEKNAHEHIAAAIEEIRRIERLLTTFDESSQTNLINRFAGISPVEVDTEVVQLIQRANRISRITQGAFDISYGGVDKKLWNFDQHMTSLPDPATARQSVRLIDYRNVLVDEKRNTVFLTQKGMRIGFGGIGKGYAAEQAKKILVNNGVTSGIVNAAGDLAAFGCQPNGDKWTIGIASPEATHHPFSWMQISDMAVATSGNYEKYAIIDGKKYSHTIDPRTGLPVTGIKSVTIISPNAELSDAMATPVMIMGIEAGLHMIDQIRGIGCIVIDDLNHIHTSKNIQLQ